MKLLRNHEIFVSAVVFFSVSAAAAVSAYIMGREFGRFTLVLCVIFILLHLISNRYRYKQLSDLALKINNILHDDSCILINEYSEGELALLSTEIYKMTVRLREQSDLLKKDKLRLSDFLADVSHQIRTPLTSMNILVSLLEKPDLTLHRRLEITHEMYELLSRIEWLITALLKISKLDAGTITFRKDNISLAELISKASLPVQIPMELRGQELIVKAEGDICGDEAWNCEAVGNILKNCMEHTPEGGRITVCAAENTLYSEIIISDNGCGISKEDLPHIFERFYKGKSSGSGSFGIGLALARMIITGQNGTIKAESPAEGGARFTIRFYKCII